MPPTTTYFLALTNRIGFVIKSISEKRVVSKPQNVSKLRYVNIVRPTDETQEEKSYRLKYESLQDWNNKYWAENNELFKREKNDYIEKTFGPESSKEDALSHDQLAGFYQTFLEKNRRKHIDYNRIWYKNHVALLASSALAKISRLKVNFSSTSKQNAEDGSSSSSSTRTLG